MPSPSPAAQPSPALPRQGSAPNRASRRAAGDEGPSTFSQFTRSWLPWLFVLAAILTALNYDLPHEISSWHSALANSHYLDFLQQQKSDPKAAAKSQAEAFASLGRAISWNPTDVELYNQRMEWQKQQGNFAAALEDANRLVELLPDNPAGLGRRSELLFRLGKYEEALTSADQQFELLKQSQSPQLFHALNARAYLVACSAAAGHATPKQVEQAIQDVKQALFEVTRVAKTSAPRDLESRLHILQLQATYLDTLGYLCYWHGDLPQALEAMQHAVVRGEYVREMKYDIRDALENTSPRINADADAMRGMMAVLYQHRGKVFDKLGRKEEAQADFKRAKDFGYDPAKGDF